MKNKLIFWFIIYFLLTNALLIPKISLGNTILGESAFPVDEGDVFIWEKVNATEEWYIEVDYVRFTVEAIYNLTYDLKNYLYLNYSLDFYHRFAWVPKYENTFYMAYNKTLNFLNWSDDALVEGVFFIFPIPLNLSFIQETIDTASLFNVSILGNKLIFDYENNTKIEHTVDSSGFSKVIEKFTNETTIFKWELNEEKIIIRIPFGFSIFFYIGIGIFYLVIVTKIKIKRNLKSNFRNRIV